ncbi:hypothetical protein [Neorhizobium petrolearium]|uniref:hypothetical protein n=1 Tax=Neorhizobium petrolearium TaxID=515361 RepID=UPI003F164CDC
MAKKARTEHSDFSGEYEEDGITVIVDIFRPLGSNGPWTMEVTSPSEEVTEWEEPFETEEEAWLEFVETVEAEGIWTFLDNASPAVH